MDPIALLQRGMPPTGLGVFLRESWQPGPWHFACVNAWRADAASLADAAHAAGCQVWLYGTPDRFTPDAWEASLAQLRARARSVPHVVGIIVDAENGWTSANDAQAAAMGNACAEAAAETRVGFTSFPSWPCLPAFARAAGEAVFGVVQIYARSSQDPAAWASWKRRWDGVFGVRSIIATAGWVSHPSLATDAGFRHYLDNLPRSSGAIVWPATGGVPRSIVDAYAQWAPGGSTLGTLGLAAMAELGRPPALVAVAVAVVLVACIAYVWAGRR